MLGHALVGGKVRQVLAFVAGTDDDRLGVDGGADQGQGADQFVDVLLDVQAADEGDGGPGVEVVGGAERGGVDVWGETGQVHPAGGGPHRVVHPLGAGEGGGEGGGGGDDVGGVEDPGDVAPGPLLDGALEGVGQAEVVHEVVGHEVVGGHHRDAQLLAEADQGAADEDPHDGTP